VGSFSACPCLSCWSGGLCFGRARNRGFVLYIFLYLRAGVVVVVGCVRVCACMHTHTTWGTRYEPRCWTGTWELAESSLTKALYTWRLYMCTRYIYLCICWAVPQCGMKSGLTAFSFVTCLVF